jgi:elongation factor G
MARTQRIHEPEQMRNLALVGPAGAGKTSLLEMLLHRAVANLLDTPGLPDLIGRSLSVLSAVETAVVVLDACHGLDWVAAQIMRSAAEHRLCRLVVINKIDAPGAEPESVLRELTSAFGPCCLPLNLPARRGQAVADCFFEPAEETPDFASVAAAHTAIMDQVIELDDALMERYLEQGQSIDLAALHDPFERALRRGHLIPVCFTSAATGAGVRQLLRVITRLLPSPLEGNPPSLMCGSRAAAEPLRIDPHRPDAHFLAHVFRVSIDAYVGRTVAFRVHQGSLGMGDQVYVGERRKAVRLAHLYWVQGRQLEQAPKLVAGDIAAVSKIDDIGVGDVIHSTHDEDGVWLRAPTLPAPMHSVAVVLDEPGQEKKLSDALHKLAAEDPSLGVELDTQCNETLLRGMGELHLRLVLERMRDQFGIKLTAREPKVAYRETILAAADGHCRHKKQTGGAGQFGEVFLRVEPLARGGGFEFANEVVGGAIPSQYLPAVEKGIRHVLDVGVLAGYPIQDVKVVVYDGKHHPVDSKEVAFVMAGKRAFVDALCKAQPVLLEPVARLRISIPGQYVGDVTGHLAGIRGRVTGSSVTNDNWVALEAQVPVAELGHYQATLKSLTGGSGSFTLQLDHYDPAPPAVQATLAGSYRPHLDD